MDGIEYSISDFRVINNNVLTVELINGSLMSLVRSPETKQRNINWV